LSRTDRKVQALQTSLRETEARYRSVIAAMAEGVVIIGRDGKIAWREIGIIKPDVLRKELDKLLLPKVTEAVKVAKAEKAKTKNSSLVPA